MVLSETEVYRLVKPVDITPALALLDKLSFFRANPGGDPANPKKMPCDVVVRASFPPILQAFVEDFGLGGHLGRAIIRRLAPYQGIPPHIDEWMPGEANWRRFQLPLISHPDIKMRWPDDGVELHLEPGKLYEVRFDRTHEVINPTDVARTHLQIDQIDATI